MLLPNSAWGSWINYSKRKRVLLGTRVKKSDETGYTKLLWLQKISNHVISKPTNQKFAKGAN